MRRTKHKDSLWAERQSVPVEGRLCHTASKLDITPCCSKREAFGRNLQAVVTETVQNTTPTGQKIFSIEDRQKLQDLVVSDFNNQLQSQDFKESALDTAYVLASTIDPDLIQYNYSADINQITDKVEVDASVDTQISILKTGSVIETIVDENSDIENVDSIQIQEITETDSSLILDVFFEYTEKVAIDTQEVKETLQGNELDQSKQDIMNQYPNVTEITEDKSGASLPFLPTRIFVDIEEV